MTLPVFNIPHSGAQFEDVMALVRPQPPARPAHHSPRSDPRRQSVPRALSNRSLLEFRAVGSNITCPWPS